MSEWAFEDWKKGSENWPVTEQGQKIKPVFLQHVQGSQIDMEMAVNLLEAYGIPTVCRYPNNGEFGLLILGFAGTGMDIFVPETMLEDAQNILCGDVVETGEE